VYPNPFTEQVNLDINLANKESLSVNLYSLEGALISNLYMLKELAKGTHTLELNTSGVVAKGIYLMQIKIGEQEKWVKLVKD
jgi:hypothetical protein